MRTIHPLCAVIALTCALPAVARTRVVHPGESIQEAVDRSRPGDTVLVLPGLYREPGRPCPTNAARTCAVVISKDDIRLIGKPRPGAPVVLENAGGQHTGIAVARVGATGAECLSQRRQRIDGSLVEGFTIKGFDRNGIFMLCVDHWLIDSVAAHDNAAYGLFPSHCGPGRVVRSVATGANDTGIYVGQSHDVRMDHNLAYDNVNGFEVESSIRVQVEHNVAFQNTAGLVMFIEPDADILVSQDNRIAHNVMYDNNRPNTCEPGDEVCLIPPGVGILSVGGERNRIENNWVWNNDTVGIALVDSCSALGLEPDSPECAALGFNPFPRDTRIQRNVALGNGTAPAQPPGADLLWNGTGTGNCWRDNLAVLLVPPELPRCD